MKIAVCILTLNEELNIGTCLEFVKTQFNDVHVIDSGSSDKTHEITNSHGVNLYVNKQNGTYSAAVQRNWAMENINSEAEWVLFIDADEIPTNNFSEEVIKNVKFDEIDVVSIPLLFYFHGNKVKCMGYPNWHDRLVKRNKRFKSAVGEFVDSENRQYVESAVIDHHFNSMGMARFMEKQARYADYIGKCVAKFNNGENVEYFEKQNSLLKRRIAKLGLLRPFFRFCYVYFLRKGFLEGKSGFLIACYMSVFEFLVVVSSIEENLKKDNKRL